LITEFKTFIREHPLYEVHYERDWLGNVVDKAQGKERNVFVLDLTGEDKELKAASPNNGLAVR
jgi:hypothetical protein